MNNIYLLFYLWTHAEENPGWILQYDIQLCHQIKPRQKTTIVSQFLLICRLLLPVCTQLSQLYQSTIFNAGVKFHITRAKPKVKVQSCSLMWRSRCVKKKLNLPIFSTSFRNIRTKEPLVRSGLQNNNTQPFMCSKLTLTESKEIAARGQFVRHGKK